MNNLIRRIFENMRALDVTEMILLTLCAVFLPWSWQLSLKMLYLLVLNGTLKCIAYKEFGNKSLDKKKRIILCLLPALYISLAISALYSTNSDVSLNFLTRKLPLLVFPLYFLLCAMPYFNRIHLRSIAYLFTISLIIKFIYRLTICIVSHKALISGSFDPLHHTYMAMYLLFAATFLYSEIYTNWYDSGKGQRILLILCAIAIAAYTFLVQSRTGILGLILLAVAIILHQAVILKHIKTALIATAIALVCGTTMFLATPERSRRLAETVKEANDGDHSDMRYFIMSTSMNLAVENLPWGVGIGDRPQLLLEEYEKLGHQKAIDHVYNPHNIYIDALLTAGIPCLLILIAVLTFPAIVAIKRKDIILAGFIFSVALTGFFEEIFDRQMGILFLGLMYTVCIAGTKQNTTTC